MNNVDICDREAHKELILDILKELNNKTDNFVLKGGICLMMFYNSDRFSEDIDLDGYGDFDILGFLTKYCDRQGYTLYIKKDTKVVKRVTIHYSDLSYLKIEVSYRNFLNREPIADVEVYKGVQIYSLNRLFQTKLDAYKSRGKLRDIYDLNHMYLNYKQELTSDNVVSLRRVLYSEDKDMEYILSILVSSEDEYISTNLLLNKIIKMFDELKVYLDDDIKSEIIKIEEDIDTSVKPLQFGKR